MEYVSIKNIKDPICQAADFNADIVSGKFIIIFGQSGRRATQEEGAFSRRFNVGDRAVYHTYNLIYTGTIVSIGKSTVTIKDHNETKRLSLLQFCRMNWNYDANAVDAHNAAERMCI